MDYAAFFPMLNPGFFEERGILALPEDRVFTELALDLRKEHPRAARRETPRGIMFGVYQGDSAALQNAVCRVDEGWARYFTGGRVFCALKDRVIAVFCVLDDMGTFQGLHIGGPGCVGTVPGYRRQGIGLEMGRRATLLLQQEGFDLSWIHYTHLENWYGQLGHHPVLRWNSRGNLARENSRGNLARENSRCTL